LSLRHQPERLEGIGAEELEQLTRLRPARQGCVSVDKLKIHPLTGVHGDFNDVAIIKRLCAARDRLAEVVEISDLSGLYIQGAYGLRKKKLLVYGLSGTADGL
jgi:hypothetical protein